MIAKTLMAINILDKALAKSEVSNQIDIQTNAIIHHINNQAEVAIRGLKSARLELDAISKNIENYYIQESAKIIIADKFSAEISKSITLLLTIEKYSEALALAHLRPNIISQKTLKLLS